jgi:hypothetical protein
MALRLFNDPTVLIVAADRDGDGADLPQHRPGLGGGRFGDHTPRYQGFLRFDPQTHLEPMGVLFLFLLGFGWTKPVPVNSRNYPGSRQQGGARLVLGAAGVPAGGDRRVPRGGHVPAARQRSARVGLRGGRATYAILHAVINLFPVFPLDGARAALAWGDRSVRQFVQQLAQFGILGFIVIFMLLSATGVTGAIMSFFRSLIVGGVNSIFNLFG